MSSLIKTNLSSFVVQWHEHINIFGEDVHMWVKQWLLGRNDSSCKSYIVSLKIWVCQSLSHLYRQGSWGQVMVGRETMSIQYCCIWNHVYTWMVKLSTRKCTPSITYFTRCSYTQIPFSLEVDLFYLHMEIHHKFDAIVKLKVNG